MINMINVPATTFAAHHQAMHPTFADVALFAVLSCYAALLTWLLPRKKRRTS